AESRWGPRRPMTLYVLDTDTLQLFQEGHAQVVARVLAVAPENRAISVVTVEEQLTGWYTQLRQGESPGRFAWGYCQIAATVRFLSQVQIIDFDDAAMARCALLRKRKLKLGTLDLRIASSVLEHDTILVTRNLRDFRQVAGLRLEDWSK